jgi:hypothetical protein
MALAVARGARGLRLAAGGSPRRRRRDQPTTLASCWT